MSTNKIVSFIMIKVSIHKRDMANYNVYENNRRVVKIDSGKMKQKFP